MTAAYSPVKPLDFKAYLAYDNGAEGRYELLDNGELIELSNENDININLAMDLYEYLKQFVSRRLIRMNATAIEVTPMSVRLANGRTRQVRRKARIPDLMVLTPAGFEQIRDDYSGISLEQDNPLLVAEVVSESNSDEDYTDKRAQYEARGIPEYWIIDRHQQVVTILILKGGQYQEACYQGTDFIQSAAFSDFSMTADKLLTEDDV
ncbi:MAG: Uma2 family endonuclease [Cyanobacteria bacterium J06598_1]